MRFRANARPNRARARSRKTPARALVGTVMLFYFSAFLLIALKGSPDTPDAPWQWQGFALALAVPAMIFVSTSLLPRLFSADRLLLTLTNFLCALGVLILYSTDAARGLTQALYYGAGIVAMLFFILLVRFVRRWRPLVWLMYPLSFGLLVLPLLIGQETNGATNWIQIRGVSMQPSEFVKLSLFVVLAYYMSRRRMFAWLLYAVGCLGVLMLQKDLGTALLYFGTTLLLFYASTGNIPLTLAGVAGGCGAAVFGYARFAHVRRRVAIWLNPWSDYENAGFQIVQCLMAIASGGLFGVGLGLGTPRVIPVYYTDCIFAVICEQFGMIFGLCVLLVYVALVLRGTAIALESRQSFHALLAMGCTVMLGLQTFVIIGGVIKLIPLTGVTMPFVSYGGSSLVSCMSLIGILQGVASVNDDALARDADLARAARVADDPEADA